MEEDVTIPKWFLIIQSVFTPVICAVCLAAATLLWDMRQELTTLNIKFEYMNSQIAEVAVLRQQLHLLDLRMASQIKTIQKKQNSE